jgi:sugar phosphate isomerase/epimerase
MAKDFEGTLARVAAMGYTNIEFAGLYNHTPEQVKAICDKHKLTPVSAHTGVNDDPANLKAVIEAAKVLGYKYIVSGLPDWNMKSSAQGYRDGVKILAKGAKVLADAGLTYCYHNHSFEYDKLEGGVTGMDILYGHKDPAFNAELDVYWVQHGHADPVAWINKLSGRVPLLHIKDMVKNDTRGFAEVGTGTVDFKAILKAAPAAGVKYLIVEQDSNWINGDALASAELSLKNLKKLVAG